MEDPRTIEVTERIIRFLEGQGVSRRDFLRMLASGAGAAAAGGLLAACGASAVTPTAPAASAPPTSAAGASQPTAAKGSAPVTPVAGASATPAASAASSGVAPKVLVYASGQDISNLDPHTGHDYSIASTQKSVYDTLLRYQGNPPELQKVLAASVSSSPDAKEWTITLVKNAKFHDGSPVKADAVVYSFGRLLRKKKGPAWMFVDVMDDKSAAVVDDYTVKVTLNKSFAPFEQVLPWLFVANPAVVKAHDQGGDEGEAWLKDHEAGSGPFTIKRWEVGSAYEFEAVPDYWWGWNKEGRLSGYIWKIIRENSSRRLALQKGDVQFADYLSPDDLTALASEKTVVVNDQPSFSAFAIKLNNQRGPTADINVRKAIAYAFDYNGLMAAEAGRATLMVGPLPSNLTPWHKADLPVYRTDLAKAKAALAQSKTPDGGFELEYVYVTGLDIEKKIGLIMLDQLSKLNIKLKMTPLLWPDMVARAKKVETSPDMMAVYSGTTYADPDNFLWQAYYSKQAGFWAAASHYQNADFDKLLEEGRATTDQAKRKQIYDQAQLKLVEDAVEIWGMSEMGGLAWTQKLGGYKYCPIMGFYFQPIYLK